LSSKKSGKLNNFLGFRLSEGDILNLEKIAKIENRSRSLVAKQAVRNWITLESFRKTNNMIIITKSMFYQLISKADTELLNSLVIEIAELLGDMTRFDTSAKMDLENFKIYSKNIIRFLSNTGLRWFNTIDFILKKDILTIKGLHDLGEGFSEFFTMMIEYYLETFFSVELDNKTKNISSNLIYLEYIIKILPE